MATPDQSHASEATQAFNATRTALLAKPYVGAWLPVLSAYRDLAAEIAERWLPGWWQLGMGPIGWAVWAFTDRAAFEAEQNAMRREVAALNGWIAALTGAAVEGGEGRPVDQAWAQEALRSLQRVALSAGAWDEGASRLLDALRKIPADLAEGARDVVEGAGRALEKAKASPWTTAGLVAGGLVLAGIVVLKVRGR